MLSFQDQLQKKLEKKKLSDTAVWAIAINIVNKFFGVETIWWYLKFDTLFLDIFDQGLKIDVNFQKLKIIAHINLTLTNLWFSKKIKVIRFK